MYFFDAVLLWFRDILLVKTVASASAAAAAAAPQMKNVPTRRTCVSKMTMVTSAAYSTCDSGGTDSLDDVDFFDACLTDVTAPEGVIGAVE